MARQGVPVDRHGAVLVITCHELGEQACQLCLFVQGFFIFVSSIPDGIYDGSPRPAFAHFLASFGLPRKPKTYPKSMSNRKPAGMCQPQTPTDSSS